MAAYTFAIVFVGRSELERTHIAETEKEALRMCWGSLNNHMRDAVESIECVECDDR